MGKIELLKNPVLKLFFKSIDVPVDRASKIGSYRALKKVEENIKKGISIILFPEGTMSLKAPELGEFKNGAFKMAVDQQVEIVPVSFLNNYRILPGSGKRYGSIPGLLKAYVHAPVSTIGLKTEEDIEKLKQNIVNLMDQKLQSYANQ